MYHIYINDEQTAQIEDVNAAWSAYRATARVFENKAYAVCLYDDEVKLHEKAAGLMLIEDVDGASVNDVLFALLSALNIDFKTAKSIVKQSGLELSNSRIEGWFRTQDNRKFVQMYNDELVFLIPHFVKASTNHAELGFTPDNLRSMRKQLGLTQEQTAQIVGVFGNRQVRRWEKGEQQMPHEKWLIFVEYFRKNSK